MKKLFLILGLTFIVINGWAGSYAGDFIKIGPGVRAQGMGGAFAAIADDGSAFYWNPAGLAQIKKPQIELMRAFLYDDLATYDNLSVCLPLPNDVVIGFNWTRLTIEDIPYYSEEHLIGTVDQRIAFPWLNLTGVPDGNFSSFDDLFQFTFAKYLRYNWDLGWFFYELPIDIYLGGNFKYIKRSMWNYLGSGTGFDLSLKIKSDLGMLTDLENVGKLSLGLNFQDLGGTTISWDTESDREDEILFNTKLGAAWEVPLNFINSEAVFAWDMDYVYGNSHNFGMEIEYKRIVAFRAGLKDSDFTAGLSVSLYDVSVDYAFLTNTLGPTNRVGIKVTF